MATQSQDRHGALLQHLCDNLVHRCRVRPGTKLLVAVSGGADSVALLRLLAMAVPSRQWLLEVAHFDHRLRPESQEDATFVQHLATELGLPLHSGSWSTPAPGEAEARQARLAYLLETAQQNHCGVIVLGHHLDDQIETVLMRLGRGCGPRGLLGMAWRRHGPVDFVRPLLDVPRARLLGFLESIGQAWREDPSNQEPRFLRNRLRLQVLPALEQTLGPGWREHWSTSLEDQRVQWRWVERESARLLELARRQRHRAAPETRLETCSLQVLQGAPEPLLRASLQIWLESAGARDLRRSHLLDAVHLVQNGQTGQKVILPGGIRLHRERRWLTLDLDRPAARLDDSKTFRPISYRLETRPVEPPAAARIIEAEKSIRESARVEGPDRPIQVPDVTEALVCADRLGQSLTVRTVISGERIRLLGAPGRRRVARVLQDHAIPARLREAWPVVADEEGIVWIPGAGVAERCRLEPSSQGALRLRLTQEGPD